MTERMILKSRMATDVGNLPKSGSKFTTSAFFQVEEWVVLYFQCMLIFTIQLYVESKE